MVKRRLLLGGFFLATFLATGCCRMWDRWCGGPHYAANQCAPQCCNPCAPVSGYSQGQAQPAPAHFPAQGNCACP